MGPSGSAASSTFHPPPRGNEERAFGNQHSTSRIDYMRSIVYERW